jgi:dienelactone hydrolase
LIPLHHVDRRAVLLGLLVVCVLAGGHSLRLNAAGQERRAAASPQHTAAPSASVVKLASFVKLKGEGVIVSGYLAKPAGGSGLPAGLPAVLLVPGTSDLKGAVLEAARAMAAHGFVALAVDYDPDRVSQKSELVQSIAEEQLSLRLTTGVHWLARQRPLVDPQRISAIGWGAGSARVLALGRQGLIRAGVTIDESPCPAPQNLPAVPVARILVAPILMMIGGCAPEAVQQRTREIEGASPGYQVRVFEAPLESFPRDASAGGGTGAVGLAWNEIYKFLEKTDASAGLGQEAPAPPSSSVATIRDIMRVINSDDGVKGKLAGLLATPSNADVPWELARSHAAILVESCDWLLARRPPKGSLAGWRGRVADFKAATQTLLQSVEQHNLPAAQQALSRLPQSCGTCHRDHR